MCTLPLTYTLIYNNVLMYYFRLTLTSVDFYIVYIKTDSIYLDVNIIYSNL